MSVDNKKKKQIIEQIKFCQILMNKLVEDVEYNIAQDSSWWGIYNHTQMTNDSIRLRRELNKFNKMIENNYNS